MKWLKDFWWAGWNHKRVCAQLVASKAHLYFYANLVMAGERAVAEHRAELALLTKQTEHDALMLQAYANWCAARDCTPTRKDLEIASGKK